MTQEFIKKRNQLSERIFESTKGKVSIAIWTTEVSSKYKTLITHAGHIVISILDKERNPEHEIDISTNEFDSSDACKNYLETFIDTLNSVCFN